MFHYISLMQKRVNIEAACNCRRNVVLKKPLPHNPTSTTSTTVKKNAKPVTVSKLSDPSVCVRVLTRAEAEAKLTKL